MLYILELLCLSNLPNLAGVKTPGSVKRDGLSNGPIFLATQMQETEGMYNVHENECLKVGGQSHVSFSHVLPILVYVNDLPGKIL